MDPLTDEEIRKLIQGAVQSQLNSAMGVYISNHATDPKQAAVKLRRAMRTIREGALTMISVIEQARG